MEEWHCGSDPNLISSVGMSAAHAPGLHPKCFSLHGPLCMFFLTTISLSLRRHIACRWKVTWAPARCAELEPLLPCNLKPKLDGLFVFHFWECQIPALHFSQWKIFRSTSCCIRLVVSLLRTTLDKGDGNLRHSHASPVTPQKLWP